VSVGTLYQYFADKTALVTALVERYLALMRDAVDEVVRRDPLDDPTLTLRRALAALLAVKLARLDLVLALRAPMAQLGGEQWVRASLGAFAASFAPLVRRALGPDPPEALIRRRAAIAVAAAEGAITAVAYDAPADLGEPWFLDEITAIAAAALRPPYTGAVDGG
jgi:AcrR family transcriptional regulator